MLTSDFHLAQLRASPNFDERKTAITYILLHYTGMVSCEAALERLCDENAKVSAHYLIDMQGKTYQMVSEEKRAWHAGVSYWKGERDINSASIGIELENLGHEYGYHNFPKPQMDALVNLCSSIKVRHDIKDILAHSDVAPKRKQDPGEKFPWEAFGAIKPEPITAGINYQQGDEGPPIQAIQLLFSNFGYELPITGVFDEQTQAVVSAFQRHYRPQKVDGIVDLSTLKTLRGFNA